MRGRAASVQHALGSITLLNDPTFVEAARVFAANIVKQGGKTDAERLKFAYRRAVSRVPDSREQVLLFTLLEKSRNDYRSQPQDVAQVFETGLAEVPASEREEIASWTSVARAILNLSETNTRN